MSLTVMISGEDKTSLLLENTFVLTNAIGQRDTFQASLVSPDGSYAPAAGVPVVVTHSELGHQFGGKMNAARISEYGGPVVTEFGCASWEQILDRRLAGQVSYVDQPAGTVASDLLVKFAGGENITASVLVAGPNITVSFDFCTLREAMDQICALATDDSATYMWDIRNHVFRFYNQTSFHAPFDIDDNQANVVRPMTVSWSFADFWNKGYGRAPEFTTEPITEEFAGDGSATEFNCALPLAVAPTINLISSSADLSTDQTWEFTADGSPVYYAPHPLAAVSAIMVGGSSSSAWSWTIGSESFADDTPGLIAPGTSVVVTYQYDLGTDTPTTSSQTVGILGVDSGQQWYWEQGSPTITQDPGGTALAFPARLSVTYQGTQSTVIDGGQDDESVNERATVEGGTGWYMKLVEISKPGVRMVDAVAYLQALIKQYSRIPLVVEYRTDYGGIRAGMWQQIASTKFGTAFDATFIIESSTLVQEGGQWFWHIRAVSGALAGGWVAKMRALASKGIPLGTTVAPTELSPLPLALTAAAPSGLVDVPYVAPLIATGGTQPYSFSISAGSLPAWASLDASSGVISGTPTAAATTTVTARVADAASATKDYELDIVIAVPAAGSGEDLSGSITSLTATDDTANRWSDPALHAVVPVAIALSAYPRPVTIETTSAQYGRINHGVFLVTGSTTINIGARYTGTDIYPPTVNDETVTVRAVIGRYDQTVALSGVTGVQSTTVTVHKPGTYAATGSSTAGAPTLVDQGGSGGSKQWTAVVDFGLPLADPKFFFARVTRVVGKYVSGVWTPLPGQPTYEGVTGTPLGDWALPTYFKPDAVDHAPIFGLVGSIQSSGTTTVRMTWGPYSYDSEWNVVRLYLYLGTRQDDGSGGTKTQQSTWPGGTAYYEIALDSSKARTKANLVDPATLGAGAYIDPSENKLIVGTGDNPGNMLANANFDRAVLGASAVGWAFTGTAYPVSYGLTNSTLPNMLRLAGSAYARQGPFTVRPGQLYYAEVWWAADPGTDGGIGLAVDYFDSADVYLSSDVATATAASIASAAAVVRQGLDCTVPAGAVKATFRVNSFSSTTGFFVVDGCLMRPQPTSGAGTIPNGTGGLKLKIDTASPVTTDGSGNVTLKLSQGVGKDGSGNLVVKNGQGITFDGSGNVVPNAGPGLTFNAGGALVPNQGATVGVNPSGQLIVPSGSLGLTQFGGAYQPYGFYFGLPSPSDASVPKLIINTADWKIYRNTGGAWSKQADPADLIAGTITALVSLISPSISGGSIVGASHTITSGTQSVTISASAVSGLMGIRFVDTSTNQTIDITKDYVTLSRVLGVGTQITKVAHGSVSITKHDGSQGVLLQANSAYGTLDLFGTAGLAGVYVNGAKVA